MRPVNVSLFYLFLAFFSAYHGRTVRIRRNVQQMQQWFIAKNPLFEHCLVPVRSGDGQEKW